MYMYMHVCASYRLTSSVVPPQTLSTLVSETEFLTRPWDLTTRQDCLSSESWVPVSTYPVLGVQLLHPTFYMGPGD